MPGGEKEMKRWMAALLLCTKGWWHNYIYCVLRQRGGDGRKRGISAISGVHYALMEQLACQAGQEEQALSSQTEMKRKWRQIETQRARCNSIARQ